MAIVTQTQLAELTYAQNVDNGAGGQYDEPLLILNTATFKATMGDGSSSPLADYFAIQAKTAFSTITTTQGLAVFKALVSAQTVCSAATPAVTAAQVGDLVTFSATIPAGYVGSFVWGMTPSIAGGYALPGSAGAGGGGGGSEVTAVSIEAVQPVSLLPADPDAVTFVANPVVVGTPLLAQLTVTLALDSQLGTTTARVSIEKDGGGPLIDIPVSLVPNVVVPTTLTVVDTAPGLGGGWNVRVANIGAGQLWVNTLNPTQFSVVTHSIAP